MAHRLPSRSSVCIPNQFGAVPDVLELDALAPRVPPTASFPDRPGGSTAERLTVQSGDGTSFGAALAECPDSLGGPAVIILPDVRGLYRFYFDLAERFVKAGFDAIAIDYCGRTAGVEERDDDFDYLPHRFGRRRRRSRQTSLRPTTCSPSEPKRRGG